MDRRRAAYTQRLVKASQREKYLAALAVLGVAVGVAGVLSPPLDLNKLRSESEPAGITHAGAGAVLASVAAAPVAERAAPRRIYPYSIIPGGVADAADLARVIRSDHVVAAHYAGFGVANARAVTVTAPRAVFVSYRKGDQVYWTRKKLMLAPGETILTDGENEMRARCANRISDVPRFPVEAHGPTESELDSFVTDEGGGLMAVAAELDGLDDGIGSGQPFQAAGFADGAGLLTPASAPLARASRAGLTGGAPGLGNPPVSYGGRIADPDGGASDGDTGATTPTPANPAPGSGDAGSGAPGATDPTVPGSETGPGNTPGDGAGTNPGTTPGTTPGTNPGTDPGADPGTTPGTNPGTVPGTSPGIDPDPDSGPGDGPELPPVTPGEPGEPGNPTQPGNPGQPVETEPDAPADVPEPGTLWLSGAAFAAMLWLRRKGRPAGR